MKGVLVPPAALLLLLVMVELLQALVRRLPSGTLSSVRCGGVKEDRSGTRPVSPHEGVAAVAAGGDADVDVDARPAAMREECSERIAPPRPGVPAVVDDLVALLAVVRWESDGVVRSFPGVRTVSRLWNFSVGVVTRCFTGKGEGVALRC
eukprot:gene7006-biopygen4259